MNSDKINEAAEKYAENYHFGTYSKEKDAAHKRGFEAGALSDAAKEYWFAQFELEKLKKETLAMCDIALELNSKIGTEHQSQQKQTAVWVKASERLPEENICIDIIGKSAKGRIDIYSWDSMMQFFRPYKHEADELYEWLDEAQQKQLSNEEVQALAEKETYVDIATNFELRIMKQAFIKGFNTAQNKH
jgi:hypothetical protein